MNKMTPKQKRFCEEYVVDYNATQSAIRAGYAKNRAKEQGYQLLHKTTLLEYIDKLQEDIQERNKTTVDECVSYLVKIMRFDIADLYEDNGRLKSIHEIPKDSRLVISELSVFEEFEGTGKDRELIGFTKKLKTLDRKGAIVELMKYLGAYEKDNKQKNIEVIVNFSE